MKKKIIILLIFTLIIITGAILATGYSDGKEPKHCNHGDEIELTGELLLIDDSYFIDETELLVGPNEIISKQASPFDFDSDTVIETIQSELNGLENLIITVSGHLFEDGSLMVTMVNNLPIQPPHHPHQARDHNHPKPLVGKT
jgi:hypothetical protein